MTDKKIRLSHYILALLTGLNAGWWLIPGKVAYLIAQERDVILGRYSVGRFSVMLAMLIINGILLSVFLAPREKRVYLVIRIFMVLISILSGTIIIDLAARCTRSPNYQQIKHVYHRPPNMTMTGVFQDQPISSQAYFYDAPGYDQDIHYSLTTDAWGFRNPSLREQYDVIVLGDSFAEGNRVTDTDAWPAILARRSGYTVYNLGMSGSDPPDYLEALKSFGVKLSPHVIVCMIYEGNDFRGKGALNQPAGDATHYHTRKQGLLKTSPVRLALNQLIIDRLSYTDRDNHPEPRPMEQTPFYLPDNLAAVKWLPVAVPDNEAAKYYTFPLKLLVSHYFDQDAFQRSPGFKTAALAIREMKAIADKTGSRLVIAYAPDKAHVILPLLQERHLESAVRNYLSLSLANLPEAAVTFSTLLDHIDGEEKAIKKYCQDLGIDFISTTAELQARTAAGNQAYFTYDMHWTPVGHQLVAEKINQFLTEMSSHDFSRTN